MPSSHHYGLGRVGDGRALRRRICARLLGALAFSAALTGALVLAGCSQGHPVDAPAPSSPAPTNTAVQQDIPSETLETKGLEMKVTINGTAFTATLADNSSAEALARLLEDGPKTYALQDYAGMEKVGPLGTDLPVNDQQITTEAGDIILYQGSMLAIYYAPNSWNFTRLGRIEGVDGARLLDVMGSGSVEVTLSL